MHQFHDWLLPPEGDKDTCCPDNGACLEGEGSCSSDSDCEGSLICGAGGCAWESGRDCCRQFCDDQYDGGQDNCCSDLPGGLCREGEGDCDDDSECEGDLVCGVDNCPWDTPFSGQDCCRQLCDMVDKKAKKNTYSLFHAFQ